MIAPLQAARATATRQNAGQHSAKIVQNCAELCTFGEFSLGGARRTRPRRLGFAVGPDGEAGRAAESWAEGSRSDDASRAMAAYLARRRFGHTWRRVETCGSEQRPFIENLLMTKCALTPVPAPVSA